MMQASAWSGEVKNGCGLPPRAVINAFTGPSGFSAAPQAMQDPTIGMVTGMNSSVRHSPTRGIRCTNSTATRRAKAICSGLMTRLNSSVRTIVAMKFGSANRLW